MLKMQGFWVFNAGQLRTDIRNTWSKRLILGGSYSEQAVNMEIGHMNSEKFDFRHRIIIYFLYTLKFI